MVRESQMSGNATALFAECLDGSLWACFVLLFTEKVKPRDTRFRIIIMALLLWTGTECQPVWVDTGGNSHHAMDGKLNVNPIQSTTYAELKLTYLFMKRAGHFQVDWRQEGGAMGFS